MEEQELLEQIKPYQMVNGGYDLSKMMKNFGTPIDIVKTFGFFCDDEPDTGGDARLALALELNKRMYDEKKAAEKETTQAALSRALVGTGDENDWRLLEKRGLAVAEYNYAESNAPSGYHIRSHKDIDGNVYSDQGGLEERPGRL